MDATTTQHIDLLKRRIASTQSPERKKRLQTELKRVQGYEQGRSERVRPHVGGGAHYRGGFGKGHMGNTPPPRMFSNKEKAVFVGGAVVAGGGYYAGKKGYEVFKEHQS